MDGERDPIDVKKLSVEQLAKLLTNAYRQQVPAEQIKNDIEAGAPTNADESINVVAYAAWLLQEKHRGD